MATIINITNQSEAVDAIRKHLEKTAQDTTRVLFLMPGGSAAAIAARVWQQLSPDTKNHITATLTDERFGIVDHQDSNWRKLEELGANLNDTPSIPVLSKEATAQTTADAWEAKLQSAIKACDSVVALFGIGADHHIAGIKPDSPAALESDRIVSTYQGEDFERITIAPPIFEKIDCAFVYAEGKEKSSAIFDLQTERDFHEYPDELIKDCGAFVVYYKA